MDSKTIHGTLLNIFDTGTLLTGPAGIGKSAIALDLVDRGHQLIADDAVQCKQEKETVIGQCPTPLQDFLETRSLGIINIRKLFGERAIISSKKISLIIKLSEEKANELTRNQNPYYKKQLLNTAVPAITLSVKQPRNLSLQVEVAVKNLTISEQNELTTQ